MAQLDLGLGIDVAPLGEGSATPQEASGLGFSSAPSVISGGFVDTWSDPVLDYATLDRTTSLDVLGIDPYTLPGYRPYTGSALSVSPFSQLVQYWDRREQESADYRQQALAQQAERQAFARDFSAITREEYDTVDSWERIANALLPLVNSDDEQDRETAAQYFDRLKDVEGFRQTIEVISGKDYDDLYEPPDKPSWLARGWGAATKVLGWGQELGYNLTGAISDAAKDVVGGEPGFDWKQHGGKYFDVLAEGAGDLTQAGATLFDSVNPLELLDEGIQQFTGQEYIPELQDAADAITGFTDDLFPAHVPLQERDLDQSGSANIFEVLGHPGDTGADYTLSDIPGVQKATNVVGHLMNAPIHALNLIPTVDIPTGLDNPLQWIVQDVDANELTSLAASIFLDPTTYVTAGQSMAARRGTDAMYRFLQQGDEAIRLGFATADDLDNVTKMLVQLENGVSLQGLEAAERESLEKAVHWGWKYGGGGSDPAVAAALPHIEKKLEKTIEAVIEKQFGARIAGDITIPGTSRLGQEIRQLMRLNLPSGKPLLDRFYVDAAGNIKRDVGILSGFRRGEVQFIGTGWAQKIITGIEHRFRTAQKVRSARGTYYARIVDEEVSKAASTLANRMGITQQGVNLQFDKATKEWAERTGKSAKEAGLELDEFLVKFRAAQADIMNAAKQASKGVGVSRSQGFLMILRAKRAVNNNIDNLKLSHGENFYHLVLGIETLARNIHRMTLAMGANPNRVSWFTGYNPRVSAGRNARKLETLIGADGPYKRMFDLLSDPEWIDNNPRVADAIKNSMVGEAGQEIKAFVSWMQGLVDRGVIDDLTVQKAKDSIGSVLGGRTAAHDRKIFTGTQDIYKINEELRKIFDTTAEVLDLPEFPIRDWYEPNPQKAWERTLTQASEEEAIHNLFASIVYVNPNLVGQVGEDVEQLSRNRAIDLTPGETVHTLGFDKRGKWGWEGPLNQDGTRDVYFHPREANDAGLDVEDLELKHYIDLNGTDMWVPIEDVLEEASPNSTVRLLKKDSDLAAIMLGTEISDMGSFVMWAPESGKHVWFVQADMYREAIHFMERVKRNDLSTGMARMMNQWSTIWASHQTIPWFNLQFFSKNNVGNWFNMIAKGFNPVNLRRGFRTQYFGHLVRREMKKHPEQNFFKIAEKINKAHKNKYAFELAIFKRSLEFNIFDSSFFSDLTMDRALFSQSKVTKALLESKMFGLGTGRAINTALENNARLSMFIDGVKKGMSYQEASMRVKETLFDYGALTEFERNKIRTVSRFYTYMRKNTPLQMYFLTHNPGAVISMQRAIDGVVKTVLGNDPGEFDFDPYDQFTPEWMQQERYFWHGSRAAQMETPLKAAVDTFYKFSNGTAIALAAVGMDDMIPEELRDADLSGYIREFISLFSSGGQVGLTELMQEQAGINFFSGGPLKSDGYSRFMRFLGTIVPSIPKLAKYAEEFGLDAKLTSGEGLVPESSEELDALFFLNAILGFNVYEMSPKSRQAMFTDISFRLSDYMRQRQKDDGKEYFTIEELQETGRIQQMNALLKIKLFSDPDKQTEYIADLIPKEVLEYLQQDPVFAQYWEAYLAANPDTEFTQEDWDEWLSNTVTMVEAIGGRTLSEQERLHIALLAPGLPTSLVEQAGIEPHRNYVGRFLPNGEPESEDALRQRLVDLFGAAGLTVEQARQMSPVLNDIQQATVGLYALGYSEDEVARYLIQNELGRGDLGLLFGESALEKYNLNKNATLEDLASAQNEADNRLSEVLLLNKVFNLGWGPDQIMDYVRFGVLTSTQSQALGFEKHPYFEGREDPRSDEEKAADARNLYYAMLSGVPRDLINQSAYPAGILGEYSEQPSQYSFNIPPGSVSVPSG